MNRTISIDPALLSVYPEIRLGCLHFTAEVKASSDVFWDYLDHEILPAVKNDIEGKEWSEVTGVRGSRAAYKAFGRNPGRYRVSSEALLRRVRRGDELYHVNSVVDVNNLISVESGLSVGSYDLEQLQGDIVFRKAEASQVEVWNL
ncbi:MAG TPA: hypothetical protein DD387_02305 [Lachnoclostridium sp.]|nr:hypothetical protein [Lachnoclostridium sp.]